MGKTGQGLPKPGNSKAEKQDRDCQSEGRQSRNDWTAEKQGRQSRNDWTTEKQDRDCQSEGRRNSKTEKQEMDGQNNGRRGSKTERQAQGGCSAQRGPCGGDKEVIIQNLRDAGCDEKTCTSVACDLTEGRTEEGLEALKQHRRELLDHVHKGQKCIDCLDYLVYQVKKDRQDT